MARKCLRIQAATNQSQVIKSTVTDQMLRSVTVPIVFFLKNAVSEQSLISSLETVLSDYSIFSGSLCLVEDKVTINCDNKGIDLFINDREESQVQVIANLFHGEGKKLVTMLKAEDVIRKNHPVLSLTLSYFKCGGMSIGACWHHSVGDMHSFMEFMRAWAAVLTGHAYEPPVLVNDRDAFLVSALPGEQSETAGFRYLHTLDFIKFVAYIAFKAKDQFSTQIYFSEDELSAMKTELSSEAGVELSMNDALCAHMYTLIIASDTNVRKRYLSVAADYRSRMELPSALLGNMISSINLEFEPQATAGFVAKSLRAAVNSFRSEHMDYNANKALVKEIGGVSKMNRLVPRALDPVNGNLLVTNWSNQGVYDVRFNDESPLFFSPVSELPFPWCSAIVEGPGQLGATYTITLPKTVASNLLKKHSHSIHKYRRSQEAIPEITSWMD